MRDLRALAVGVVGDDGRIVAACRGERGLRATRDVGDRPVPALLDQTPATALAVVVLGEGHRARAAVWRDPDLDHLPVALVQADAEERLVVVQK